MALTIHDIDRGKKNRSLILNDKEITNDDIPLICKYITEHPDLTGLNLSNNHLTDTGLKQLLTLKSITMLDLSKNNLRDEGAKIIANHKTITALNLADNKIGDVGARALAQNNVLTRLDLNRNKIGTAGAIALAQHSTLEVLYLRGNRISNAGRDALEDNLKLRDLDILSNQCVISFNQMKRSVWNDTVLHLSDSGIMDGDIPAICDYLNANPGIKILNLDANVVNPDLKGHLSDKGIEFLSKNTQLENLSLRNNLLGDSVATVLKDNQTLTSLNLSGNTNITDTGVAELEQNKNLKQLILDGNHRISIAKQKAIQSRNQQSNQAIQSQPLESESHKQLTSKNLKYVILANTLWLHSRNVEDDDLKAICDYLNEHPEIKSLNLDRNKITDKGIPFLMSLKYITDLVLSHNSLTDKAAIELAKHKTIEILDLKSNQIGTPGAEALAQNQRLKLLYVQNNQIGSAGIEALENNARFDILNTLGNQSPISFQQLKRATDTDTLQLSNSRCDDAAIQTICDYLKENPQIKTLYFSQNTCTAKSAQLLATTAIETLYIQDNQLQDDALIALAQSKHLLHLDLSHNPNITDNGIRALENNKNLQRITLAINSGVSTEKLKAIKLKNLKNINEITSKQLKGNLKNLQVIYNTDADRLERYQPGITKPFDPQLQKIIGSFNQLKEKKWDFDIKAASETDKEMKDKYLAVATALGNTIKRLKNPIINQYWEGFIDIDDLKTEVNTILSTQEAEKDISIICTHRSAKQFWIEFIGAIFTFGASLIYKAVTGHTLFNRTDSAKRLDTLKDSLHATGPSTHNK